MNQDKDAWNWMESAQTTPRDSSEAMETARQFARVFSHHDSARVLAHLRKSTRERVFGPEVDEGTLRYVEGQRALVAYMERMIERGRSSAMATAR